MHVGLRTLDRFLWKAERVIGLVERCKPLNAAPEQQRLLSEWQAGRAALPDWRYAVPPDLSELRAVLERVAGTLASAGAWGMLYAGRATELSLEAAAAEAIGSAELRVRSAARYHLPADEDARQADQWTELWWRESCSASEERVRSDDESHPGSLIAALRREVGKKRLAFRVVLVPDLLAAAATGEDVIAVRPGLWLSPREVERIVVHEIEGHALPRQRARAEPCGLFRVGTAGGSDDEEGRALIVEQRAGAFDAGRRSTLARRHLAALCARSGGDFAETVRLLLERGAELEDALTQAARVHRGGGLAREIVYLPALSRVGSAFQVAPELEAVVERGRIAVQAAGILRALGRPEGVSQAPPAELIELGRQVASHLPDYPAADS